MVAPVIKGPEAGMTVYIPESSLLRSLSSREPVSPTRLSCFTMLFPAIDGVIADPLTHLQTQRRMSITVVVNIVFLPWIPYTRSTMTN